MLDRFVTFFKPYLNLLAGAIAAYLVAKANVLGIPGLDQENATTWIAGALAWLLTQGGAQLGDVKWLKGRHIMLAGDAQVQMAALAPVQPIMGGTMASGPGMDTEADILALRGEDLPDDEEEFASEPESRLTPDAP